jgi:hypothetical protein
VAPHEDVIALVVQGQDLAAFELGLQGEEILEQVCGQDAEGGFEVVEDELGVVS